MQQFRARKGIQPTYWSQGAIRPESASITRQRASITSAMTPVTFSACRCISIVSWALVLSVQYVLARKPPTPFPISANASANPNKPRSLIASPPRPRTARADEEPERAVDGNQEPRADRPVARVGTGAGPTNGVHLLPRPDAALVVLEVVDVALRRGGVLARHDLAHVSGTPWKDGLDHAVVGFIEVRIQHRALRGKAIDRGVRVPQGGRAVIWMSRGVTGRCGTAANLIRWAV